MSARLVPLTPGPAPTIPLVRPVVLVGRHPECDVHIDLPKVSRRHCCLALAYDRVVVKDLGSRNGLRVNGRVVDEAQLVHGDEVAIGPLLFRFDSAEPPPAAEPRSKPAPPAGATRPAPADPLPNLPFLPDDRDDDLLPIDL